MLNKYGFNILLSICDGASENRNFIRSSVANYQNNANKVKHMCVNPFTNGPMYFMSDPPHPMASRIASVPLRTKNLETTYTQVDMVIHIKEW